MKRDLFKVLVQWHLTPEHKPILLRGARQVGKSWLVEQLGNEFESFIKLDFEENPDLATFFQGNLDPEILLTNLSNYLGAKIIPGKTLLFLDEIQACPRAVTALRYFYEKVPDLHVIGAGSLIEFELQHIAMPVGRIENLYLYPLSFGEFLTALGREDLRISLQAHPEKEVAEPIHQQLLALIRDYTIVGGMPEVVQKFLKTKSMQECQAVQTQLLEAYQKDFIKYAKRSQIKYLRMVFEAVPLQMGKKFVYSHASPEIKSRELGAAVELLEMAGVVTRIYHAHGAGIPLGATINPKMFKTLFFDIGLAQRMLGLDMKGLFLNPDITLIYQGALAELLVGLELIAYASPRERAKVYYWQREERGAQSEVDYLIIRGEQIIPIEVKSGVRGRLFSLRKFLEEKRIAKGYQISQNPYGRVADQITNIPFYGLEGFVKSHSHS